MAKHATREAIETLTARANHTGDNLLAWLAEGIRVMWGECRKNRKTIKTLQEELETMAEQQSELREEQRNLRLTLSKALRQIQQLQSQLNELERQTNKD